MKRIAFPILRRPTMVASYPLSFSLNQDCNLRMTMTNVTVLYTRQRRRLKDVDKQVAPREISIPEIGSKINILLLCSQNVAKPSVIITFPGANATLAGDFTAMYVSKQNLTRGESPCSPLTGPHFWGKKQRECIPLVPDERRGG